MSDETTTPQQEQEQLRREIERTRGELGETVEALAQKADVKAHARERVEQVKTQAREKPVAPVAAGLGLALVALWLIRRR